MRILVAGGGSGGHVTPLAVVLVEIKTRHPSAELKFWTDSHFRDRAKSLMQGRGLDVSISTITSGKLRRYYHLSLLQHLTWPKLVMLNLRDSLLVLVGFLQSLVKLMLWRPDAIFAKGGYVCLPIGMAARVLNVPIVLHDSDAHPGLTNRVLSKWAKKIATGAPLSYYDYPASRAEYVGIPIADEFHEFTDEERLQARREWGIEEKTKLVVVTGGGLGATRINDAVIKALDELLQVASVVLISGNDQYDELRSLTPTNNSKFQLHAFVSSGMAGLLGAADVVVARAGATTILELAALARPTILVPNAKLTGGHQIKNAAVYSDAEAVLILDEEEMTKSPSLVTELVREVLDNPAKAKAMAKNFSKFAKPDAGRHMAEMVLSVIK